MRTLRERDRVLDNDVSRRVRERPGVTVASSNPEESKIFATIDINIVEESVLSLDIVTISNIAHVIKIELESSNDDMSTVIMLT